jgi:tetratricopeptide (TPR) repeat protein
MKPRSRVQFAALLAGAVSAIALIAAAPASARLPWGDYSTCTSATPGMRNDRVQRAIRACTSVINNNRSTLAQTRRALISRAALYEGRNDLGHALEDYQRAVQLERTDAEALLALGRMEARVNDLDGALASFDEAFHRARSGDIAANARIGAGDVLRERSAWPEAVAAYTEADNITADPDARTRLLLGRGYANAAQGRLMVAIADYEEAYLTDRQSVQALIALADAHRVLAFPPNQPASSFHYAEALSYYNDAFQILGDRRDDANRRQLTAVVLSGRGELYLRRHFYATDPGALANAGDDFNTAVTLDSANVRALSGRAAVFSQSPAERDRAIADLDRALRFAPDSAELYRARANIYAEQGDSERAVSDYDQTIRRNGANSYAAYYRRGLIYIEEGDYRRAQQSFTQAISLASSGDVGPGVDPTTARAEAMSMRGRAAWGLIDQPGVDVRNIANEARRDTATAASLLPYRADLVTRSCLTRTVAGGDWDAASDECRRAVTVAQDPAERSEAYGASGLLQLRWALSQGSNTEEVQRLQFAEDQLLRAIRADSSPSPRTALNRYALGVALECLNRRTEANRETAAALSMDRGVAARFEAHRIRRCQ